MRPLALCVAAVSLAAATAAWLALDLWTPILAGAALVCAVATFRAATISTFLRILVATFASEVVLFGGLTLLKKFGLLPKGVLAYVPPESFAVGAAVFAILAYAVSAVPVVRAMMRIIDLYFDCASEFVANIRPLPRISMREATAARLMLFALVVINQIEVGILVRISFFNRDWFNALQAKESAQFWEQLFAVFVPWASILIAFVLVAYVVQQQLIIRSRRFLTARYIDRWLEGASHYRISLMADPADNPDQRIAEDINRFLNGGIDGGDSPTGGVYFFTIRLIATLSKVISFSVILWTISRSFTIPGTDFVLPGFLFWAAVLYTIFGTGLVHLVGRRLIPLYFERQRYEADFRFALARNREYAEQIALLRGEPQERRILMRRFGGIFANVQAIIRRFVRLLATKTFYQQISGIFPFLLTAPFYFLGKIKLGIMMQTAGAFSSVQVGLGFFITYYTQIAEFRSVLARLTSFEDAIAKARALGATAPASMERGSDIEVRGLGLTLPNGRSIVTEASLLLRHGESVLFTGPSGSGKSTLFRALAGVWPFKTGDIRVPANQRVMLLPQQPYFPSGNLRAAIAYPEAPETYGDARIREALVAVGLPALQGELDVEDNWGQRLSGGEQQRASIARALLARPDWLLLDESTSAMDNPMETRAYKVLREALPGTTLVSIGHRDGLRAHHAGEIRMEAVAPGVHRPVRVERLAAE